MASNGVAGATTFRPATLVNHDSTFWEWKGPAPVPPPDGSADHHRHARSPAVVGLGQVVHDLVEAAGDEIAELHLDHGHEAVEGEAEGRARSRPTR